MRFIQDHEFVRGKVPMSKFAVRSLVIAHLAPEVGDRYLDIGAGTGSVSVEAALQGAEVTAVERKEEAVALIEANAAKFGCSIRILHGEAPQAIPDEQWNKCFIGGSAGKLDALFGALELRLQPGGIFVATFIKPDNAVQCHALLQQYGYREIQMELHQNSQMDELGLLRAQNPVFIIKGEKA